MWSETVGCSQGIPDKGSAPAEYPDTTIIPGFDYFLYKFFGNEEREPVSREEVLYQLFWFGPRTDCCSIVAPRK